MLVTWQGLGYNRRALYLKKIAERVTLDHGGKLPRDPDILRTFPGIGRNTAGSVAAFAFDIPVPFVETNIRRAFIHNFFSHRTNVSDNEILPLIAATLRLGSGRQGFRARRWYWALMDYGAHLGETLPKIANPNRRSRHYAKQSKFEGSGRQIRGRVLKLLVGRGPLGEDVIRKNINDVRTPSIVQVLVKERFLIRRGSKLRLAD